MQKRPLVIFALTFCLGIFVASKISIPFLLIYNLALVLLLFVFLALKKELWFDISLVCLVFLLGATMLKNSQELPKCHIARFRPSKNYLYAIKGFIAHQPLLRNNRTSFVFRTQELQFDNLKRSCCGDILVQIKGKVNLDYGEGLILRGKLYRPLGFSNVNRQSYRDYLYNQGIFAVLNVQGMGFAARLNENRGFLLKRLSFWLRERMEEIISRRVSSLPASILNAMLLGERKSIPPLVNNSMIKTGTVHILVVSGFNVGILTFIVVLFLRLIRIPKKMRFYVAVPIIIIYCLMTGASTPVVRATVMAGVFLFAYLVKREPDIYNSCALAALFILGTNPRQLFDIGFQLSFASVISIVYFYPKIKSLIYPAVLKIRYIRYLIDGCLVSFSAWLGTVGFIAYYFRIISPVTLLANMFIVPLASLITLCGFSLLVIELVCPALSPFFALSAEFIVTLLLRINTLLLKLPAAYFYLS